MTDRPMKFAQKHPIRDVCILVTDIEMPGSMNGLKLASAVRKRWPPVAIIVTSGRILPANAELPSATSFLGKPYSCATMTAALSEAAETVRRIHHAA